MSQPYPPDSGQPQPPYQQPYPQQPPYPPFQQPMQQPPKKKSFLRSPLGIGCGVIAVLVVLVIVIVVIASAASSGGSPSSTAGNTSTSNTSSSTHSIGQAVTSGTWDVTVNTVSTSHGSGLIVPKAGNVFIVINVTLKNTDASAQPASSLPMFALKDSSGQTYNQDITYE